MRSNQGMKLTEPAQATELRSLSPVFGGHAGAERAYDDGQRDRTSPDRRIAWPEFKFVPVRIE